MENEIKIKITLDDTEFIEKMDNALNKIKELKKALEIDKNLNIDMKGIKYTYTGDNIDKIADELFKRMGNY